MTKRRSTTKIPIREDRPHRLEVHVAGCCFRKAGGRLELLVGHRTRTRELFPGKWECGGGHVCSGENFSEAITRQFMEEFGIQIRVLHSFTVYEILRPKQAKIPGVKFVCLPVDNGKVEVLPNPREFSEAQWVTKRQAKRLVMIPGVQADVKLAFLHAEQYFGIGRPNPSSKIGFRRSKSV